MSFRRVLSSTSLCCAAISSLWMTSIASSLLIALLTHLFKSARRLSELRQRLYSIGGGTDSDSTSSSAAWPGIDRLSIFEIRSLNNLVLFSGSARDITLIAHADIFGIRSKA